MQRSELDLKRGLWLLPGARTKNGHAHSVPLSTAAIEIIEDGFSEVSSVLISRWVNRNQLGLSGWTAHDLRRTALTRMAELGIPPIVLGHIANHRTTTKAGMTLGVYVQYPYEREKREALDLWADRLQGIVSGSGRVVGLRR
jgi:integrase